MTSLQKLLEFIEKVDYETTESEQMIVQRQRNELKYNLLAGIIEALIEQGLDRELVHRTTDGYIYELQNEELGMIPVQIDVKVKDLTYDLDSAIYEWERKIEESKKKGK